MSVICCSIRPALSNIDGTYDNATLAQNSKPHTIDVTNPNRTVEYVLGFEFVFDTVNIADFCGFNFLLSASFIFHFLYLINYHCLTGFYTNIIRDGFLFLIIIVIRIFHIYNYIKYISSKFKWKYTCIKINPTP